MMKRTVSKKPTAKAAKSAAKKSSENPRKDLGDLVRFSREGDTFHYRWAARRCLLMIPPGALLEKIVIEGSEENHLEGEFSIDVSEYYASSDSELPRVEYFQHKHSTVRVHQDFQLSGLKNTVASFAERFKALEKEVSKEERPRNFSFTIVTNRRIASDFKHVVSEIADGHAGSSKTRSTIEAYTKLSGAALRRFCSNLRFLDRELDVEGQRIELRREIFELLASFPDNGPLLSIVELVRDRVISDRKSIVREEVLNAFGVTNPQELFPAPSAFEDFGKRIQREQHEDLLQKIVEAQGPLIIEASGGVGKSVVAQQLAVSLPEGSVSVVFDCFGAGNYRNRSSSRHTSQVALVQIVNELAIHGVCSPMLPGNVAEHLLMQRFLRAVTTAADALAKALPKALVVIFIDAADNAAMAATEAAESCFATHLLKEKFPPQARLVMLCRPERTNLLHPPRGVVRVTLEPFSEAETLTHLRQKYPQASVEQGAEFRRLTSANPRVQGNALRGAQTYANMMARLSPGGMTVDKQIAAQLHEAVGLLKDSLPQQYQSYADAICVGLANLQPLIPLDVLSAAANVPVDAIKSFVADLGWPLWLREHAVQFRDEPTETWFRENFGTDSNQIEAYIQRLRPLAKVFAYVAAVLPNLLLRCGFHDELIKLALSDDYLPEHNLIDARNVRIYRLRFALQASLKDKRYVDAAKLALRAGEEISGDERQNELLKNNVDLIAPLLSAQRVEEMAYQRQLHSAWQGSENLYSASLLATVPALHSDGRLHLRYAENWMHLFFEERASKKDAFDREHKFEDADAVEFAITVFQLYGTKSVAKYMGGWTPNEFQFSCGNRFSRRLIDLGKSDTLLKIVSHKECSIFFALALLDQLAKVGIRADSKVLKARLKQLPSVLEVILKEPVYQRDETLLGAVLTLLESGAESEIETESLLQVLAQFGPSLADEQLGSDLRNEYRANFFRRVCLNQALTELSPNLNSNDLKPEKWLKERIAGASVEREEREFDLAVAKLLPLYQARATILRKVVTDIDEVVNRALKDSGTTETAYWKRQDQVPADARGVRVQIARDARSAPPTVLKKLLEPFLDEKNSLLTSEYLSALHVICRCEHLHPFQSKVEARILGAIHAHRDVGPTETSDNYVALARAVLPRSPNEASAYFNSAIEAVSQFGDEIVDRWISVVSAAQGAASTSAKPVLAYRFIRCAEVVGERVAREKYWDRSGAMVVCSSLHYPTAIAALSRWRDRNTGYFERQLSALLLAGVQTGAVAPRLAWALSALAADDEYGSFGITAMRDEPNDLLFERMRETTTADLLMREAMLDDWKELRKVLAARGQEYGSIQAIIELQSEKEPAPRSSSSARPSHRLLAEEKAVDWTEFFKDSDPLSPEGLSSLISRKEQLPPGHGPHEFYQELYKRLPVDCVGKFLSALLIADEVEHLDASSAIDEFPVEWLDRESVRRQWPILMFDFGSRFASKMAVWWRFSHLGKNFTRDPSWLAQLRKGVEHGFETGTVSHSSASLFGFANMLCASMKETDAERVLDYALERFELYIEDDFADGPYSEPMTPAKTPVEAITNLLWAALGAPRTDVRWRAAHAVYRIARVDSEEALALLVSCLNKRTAHPYIDARHPFYFLSAMQYLMMAFTRVAVEYPATLRKHLKALAQCAVQGPPHAIIQRFAKDATLAVLEQFPELGSEIDLISVRAVGVSVLPTVKADYSGRRENVTPWHSRGEVDTALKFRFAYDFDRYWTDGLASSFNLSTKSVEEVARHFLKSSWGIDTATEHTKDPRHYSSRGSYGEAFHSHSSYPDAYNYQFYVSYHALMVAAAVLFSEMPTVNEEGDEEGFWAHWQRRHGKVRPNGKWVADRRDPSPIKKPAWTQAYPGENWRYEVSHQDFLSALLIPIDGNVWINCSCEWIESARGYYETIDVAAIFVSPKTSKSLVTALQMRDDGATNIPSIDDLRHSPVGEPFDVISITREWPMFSSIDSGDPLAADIIYPGKLPNFDGLGDIAPVSDEEGRFWYSESTCEMVARAETWKSYVLNPQEDIPRHGDRLLISLEFVLKMCEVHKRDLVVQVKISRRRTRSSYGDSDGNEYSNPYAKVFLLSANGVLSDSWRSFDPWQGAN